jgi:FkbM family methyltransferase
MNWQLDFYKKSFSKSRVDGEFDWVWLNSIEGWRVKLRRHLTPLIDLVRFIRGRIIPFTQQWLNDNSELLWNSRQMLEDELSRILFDSHLLLNILDHTRYYYLRIDYDDLIEIQSEEDFINDLPMDYSGLPLKLVTVRLYSNHFTPEIKIIATKLNINLLNGYRQYFIKRGDLDFSPSTGEVVFDCGACIGDISTIFAALVGTSGEVHTFDPVPLHSRFCHLHAELNPMLRHTFHINTLAVGSTLKRGSGVVKDTLKISPGGCNVDNFETTSLDDYVSKNQLQRVDYIKMDIEGFEVSALQGAEKILRDLKPRLAICTYHKTQDLWEIPALIKKINSKYKLYFGHHSPRKWESVYYAI